MDEQIEAKVAATLAQTPYAFTSLVKLGGGTANFIYHAVLSQALQDNTKDVIVKQGEAYVATRPSFPIPLSRCDVEEECLRYLSALSPVTTSACVVGTPKIYHYDPAANTQVQEYLKNAINLKTYALEHYAPGESQKDPESVRSQCRNLGHALGAWLRSFHDWCDRPEQDGLRDIAAKNHEMQSLKRFINYQQLVQMADTHPAILGEIKDTLSSINEMTKRELQDQSALQVIHGDFWTGNVLCSIKEGVQTAVRVIDWEMAELGIRPFDLGQMIAELWQLKLFRNIDAGVWLIEAFADGYGPVDVSFVFRTILHVGAHLICFGSQTPGWGTEEQSKHIVEVGRDVLVNAWNKDRKSFDGHDLGCLFQHVE